MKINRNINRRHFIESVAAATGGLMLARNKLFGMQKETFPSTKYFWYRRTLNDPYIDSQNGNMAFGFTDDGTVLMSEDNSHTWPHKAKFANAKNITFSHIFKNGNVLFATQNKLYLSTDKLQTIQEKIVKNPDGSNYFPHVPKNPKYPGWYFIPHVYVDSWIIGGREMLVWGGYTNVRGGAAPVNIYYSNDNGHTVKIAYAFGQNPKFRDNGGPGGGGKEGTLLGDPYNPHFCRHIHCVAYNPVEKAFYACTGDNDIGLPNGIHEVKWLRGIYNDLRDEWDWKVIIEASANSRYKGGGINFVDGKMYFVADANGSKKPYDRGLFRCDPVDITNKDKHELMLPLKYATCDMIIQDGIIIIGQIPSESSYTCGIIYSPDMGKSWEEFDLKEFGPRLPRKFNYKNSEGWFRVDLRKGYIDRGEVLFIKPK